MSAFGGVDVNTGSSGITSCNTCKTRFESIELIREHYRGDWHVLNSKRRAQQLPPVTLTEFRRHIPQSSKGRGAPRTQRESQSARRGGVPDRPLRGTMTSVPISSTSTSAKSAASFCIESKTSSSSSSSNTRVRKDEEQLIKMAQRMGISKERSAEIVRMALEEEEKDPLANAEKVYLERGRAPGVRDDDVGEGEQEEGEQEEGYGEDDTATDMSEYLPVAANISIFDNKTFTTTEDCVEYMIKNLGFFIPDRSYLCDLEGLLVYLGEKVKIGGICLYCQKRFRPGRPCQDHMRSKSHCKMRYEEGIDEDEYEDYYDFSAMYEDDELDDDGNVIAEKEDFTILSTGEMQLPDGRIVGHRAFRRLYKQYFPPEDLRPSVLAAKRETLLRLEQRTGALGMSSTEIDRLSDMQVASLMLRQRKEERKQLVVAERQERRYMWREQKREYKSTVDKLRSSENTTAKIRDYHSMLM